MKLCNSRKPRSLRLQLHDFVLSDTFVSPVTGLSTPNQRRKADGQGMEALARMAIDTRVVCGCLVEEGAVGCWCSHVSEMKQ